MFFLPLNLYKVITLCESQFEDISVQSCQFLLPCQRCIKTAPQSYPDYTEGDAETAWKHDTFLRTLPQKKLLLVLYHCWYSDFVREVTPIIRDNTAANIHTITYEWWWSCGVVTVYVQCGDHNGSFKGTACFRENMSRGAPLGLLLDLRYVWIKTITTSPRKTKNKIIDFEISTIANPL